MILRVVLGSAFLNCGPIALHSEQGWYSPHPSSSIDQSRCCPGLEGGTYASWWPDPVHSHVPQLEEKCFDFLSQPRSFLAWSLTDFFQFPWDIFPSERQKTHFKRLCRWAKAQGSWYFVIFHTYIKGPGSGAENECLYWSENSWLIRLR